MLGILDTPTRPEEAPAAELGENPEERRVEEFEFVLGRRQVASLLFVATVLVMILIAVSYLAGKSATPKPADLPPAPLVVNIQAPRPPVFVNGVATAPVAKPSTASDPPIFAEPKNGMLYIQMGAVEKAIAVVFAEGLRRQGFDSFVAAGPSDKIFRVLIGPLPTTAAYASAKAAVDRIGLITFARQYP